MEYISVTQASEKWKIGVRRIRALCTDGRIDGAVKQGSIWMIPSNLDKPSDGRKFRHARNSHIRIGRHNFTEFEKLKDSLENKVVSPEKITDTFLTVIKTSLSFDDIELDKASIQNILEFKEEANSIDFGLRVRVLNLSYTIRNLVYDKEKRISAQYMKELHSSITRCTSVNEENEISDEQILVAGAWRYNQRVYSKEIQIKSLFVQYEDSFKNFYPLVRSTILFSEIMRIQPFASCNGSTSYLLMLTDLIQHGYLPFITSDDNYEDLKASLAMTVKRSNYGQIIDYVLESENKLYKSYLGQTINEDIT